MTTTDKTPTTKVAAGGATGLVAALIMWLISATGLDVPDGVLVYVPVIAAFVASYLTPDHLVELGRELRDSETHRPVGKHADDGDPTNGSPDTIETIPADVPAGDQKADAAL